jgi:hypothetical protein
VRYLVEVSDPCERISCEVAGVPVSDFLLPWFCRSSARATTTGYRHTGAIEEPLEILDGGYISFLDPETRHMWQRFVRDGEATDIDRGPVPDGTLSLREWVDTLARAT